MRNRPDVPPSPPNPDRFRQARIAVSIIFLVHGILVASWMARIPAVKERLGLPMGVLGAVLLCAAAGAVVAMPVTSHLVSRFGSARLTQFTTGLLCVAVMAPPLAVSAVTLALALFLYGASAGAMDVAMNTQAVEVEAGIGRPVMVSFHALFSIGGMIGALLGSAAARYGIAPASNRVAIGLSMALCAALSATKLVPDRRDHPPVEQSARDFLRPLIGLGIVAFCILLGEGAMADWSAVYLSQLSGPAIAPLGYAVFSMMMAIGRLAGDWFHEHLGSVATVRFGSALAAVGLAGALGIGSTAATLVGFGLVGCGLSAIFPIVCSVAGANAGGRPQAGIAAVSMTGYLGFLIGPPLIGFLAQAFSLRIGLGLVAVMSGVTTILAGIVHPPASSLRGLDTARANALDSAQRFEA